MKLSPQMQEMAAQSPIVAAWVESEMTVENLISAMLFIMRLDAEEIAALSAIVPHRYRLPSSKIVVWNCPEELIPIEDLSESPLTRPAERIN
jgi:hypothetical protein